MRTRNRPQSGKREPVPDVEVGKPSFAAVVVCLGVLRGIMFAGLINGLPKCVRSVECQAMLSTFLQCGTQSVIVAALIGLREINIEEPRLQPGKYPAILNQISIETVEIVASIFVPAHGTDVVDFSHQCRRQRALDSQEPVFHVHSLQVRICDDHISEPVY